MTPVSIITPTWHRSPDEVVSRCIASVRAQTFGDFEHIVCSDGETEPRIAALCAEGRTRYAVATKHHGGYGAGVRQEVMADVRGKYVCFLDDDNMIFPRYLERMVAALEAASAGERFAVCGILHMGPLPAALGSPPLVLPGFPLPGQIDTMQAMVEADAMREVGWVDPESYLSDGLTFAALGSRYPWVRLDECLGVHL